jgi:hypothetical protein
MGFFLFTTASGLALWPAHPPIQSVLWAVIPGIKWQKRGADNLVPSSAEVKNAWSYARIPQYASLLWYLNKRYIFMGLLSTTP